MRKPKPPVFIVGVPRSGTTLLAAMLGAHSAISCGPETHFFRRLSARDADSVLAPWPDRAADFLGSITHATFNGSQRLPLLQKYHIQRDEIESFLRDQSPSIPAVLAAVTATYMCRMGKVRWAEKTPDHIEYIRDIRRYFPESRIIRILRDPRDTALSLTKVPWGASSFAEALFLWKRQDAASREIAESDPSCYTVRFEDLIQDPRAVLSGICGFLEEDFEEGMLDTSKTGRDINSRNVPWKERVSKPVDESRIGTWKKEVLPEENRFAEALLGDRMTAYGYAREIHFQHFGAIYPPERSVEKYAAILKDVAATGVRFWRSYDGERPHVRIYLGDPGDKGWLDGRGLRKGAQIAAIGVEFLRAFASGSTTYWFTDRGKSEWTGVSGSLVKGVLSLARSSV